MKNSAMKSLFFKKRGAFSLLFFLLFSISLKAVQQLKVPLGCSWGDSPARLEELIRTGGLTMVNSEITSSGQKKIITVRGVLGPALKQNVFPFQQEELVEIEYQYGNATWGAKKYEDFFNNFRGVFEAKYGLGTPLTKKVGSITDPSGVTTSINGYEWAQSFCTLDLFYYTAEKKNQEYRLISVHYKMP